MTLLEDRLWGAVFLRDGMYLLLDRLGVHPVQEPLPEVKDTVALLLKLQPATTTFASERRSGQVQIAAPKRAAQNPAQQVSAAVSTKSHDESETAAKQEESGERAEECQEVQKRAAVKKIGATGFEPAAFRSQTGRSTKLSYAP
jgi:hypothetical protein